MRLQHLSVEGARAGEKQLAGVQWLVGAADAVLSRAQGPAVQLPDQL